MNSKCMNLLVSAFIFIKNSENAIVRALLGWLGNMYNFYEAMKEKTSEHKNYWENQALNM